MIDFVLLQKHRCSFLEIGNSIISTFGTHKIKNEVKENYKREGEVKKFSQNPLAYLIRTCMHIYVLHNTSTKLSGKYGTAKEKAKVDPERENLVESKLNIGV